MKSTKNKKWFIKTRGSYLPKSWQGTLIYLIYLTYIIWVAVFVVTSDYDFQLTIFLVMPNWIAACAATTWIASKNSN